MENEQLCYDKNKVGRLISWLGDHSVYAYNNQQVIKFSKVERMLGSNGYAKTVRDYTISKQFFGKYILPTQIVFSHNMRYSALIQQRVDGHFLFKKDLANPSIRVQFKEIMSGQNNLVKAGNPLLDLAGRGSIFKNCLSNIFVTSAGELTIIDTTLIEFAGSGIFLPILFLIRKLATWRNNSLIEFFTEGLD